MGTILLLLLLGTVVAVRYGAFGRRWWMSDRPLIPALALGAIGFGLGFFGPMILAPDANQGPLLGIFITGPVGFCLGLAWGVWKEWRRHRQ